MVMVDTTVWVDLFLHQPRAHVSALESLILQSEDICICGVILTEILQGIRDDADYAKVKTHLNSLVFLPMSRSTFVRAADVYTSLRRKGITIRKPVDCMIAAVAIEHDVPLLHNDRDFDPIEKYCSLRTIKPQTDDLP